MRDWRLKKKQAGHSHSWDLLAEISERIRGGAKPSQLSADYHLDKAALKAAMKAIARIRA